MFITKCTPYHNCTFSTIPYLINTIRMKLLICPSNNPWTMKKTYCIVGGFICPNNSLPIFFRPIKPFLTPFNLYLLISFSNSPFSSWHSFMISHRGCSTFNCIRRALISHSISNFFPLHTSCKAISCNKLEKPFFFSFIKNNRSA